MLHLIPKKYDMSVTYNWRASYLVPFWLTFILHKDSFFISCHIQLHLGGGCVGVIQTFAKPSVFAITVLKGNTRVGHEVKTTLGHLPEPRGVDNSLWEMHFCKKDVWSLTRPSYRIEGYIRRDRLHVQYSTVQYSTIQYNTVQYSTVQYSTLQYITVQ